MKRTFKEILSELGEALDEAFTVKSVDITVPNETEIDYGTFTLNPFAIEFTKIGTLNHLDILVVRFDDKNSRYYAFETKISKFQSVGINIVKNPDFKRINNKDNGHRIVGVETNNGGLVVDGQAAKL